MIKEFFNYKKHPFRVFLITWFVLCGVFNALIEVNGEEAYYWLFSEFPAWGYLDHPPMVAFVTAPFYWLFPNAFGLRLGMLIVSILTLIIIKKTLLTKDDNLLIWLILGSIMAHAGAYHVKTDVPLLFFVALFFYYYKRYLESDNVKTVFLLALSIAGIMLSKHHGFLMVIFTVASNPNLFLRKSFWLTILFTTLLMIPHTLWQFQNEFATIKFHLYNRIDMGFSWDTIAYYIGIQPIVFGPLVGVMLIGGTILNRNRSDFRRALRFCVVGVLLFFLISTFKVEFHKHWTSILFIPFILLGHEYITQNVKWRLWAKRLMIISMFIIIPAKIYLAYDFLPQSWTQGWDVIHGWNSWAEEIEELSGGLPIIFNNHYERASRYAYLTGDIVHCYNTVDYRPTHHDLLTLEEDLQGKTVFQINRYRDTTHYNSYNTQIGKGIHYRILEDFRSFRKVWVELLNDEVLEELNNGPIQAQFELSNKYDHDVDFSELMGRSVKLKIYYLRGLEIIGEQTIAELDQLIAEGEVLNLDAMIEIPDLEAGSHDLRFAIEVEGIEPPINSKKYKIELE